MEHAVDHDTAACGLVENGERKTPDQGSPIFLMNPGVELRRPENPLNTSIDTVEKFLSKPTPMFFVPGISVAEVLLDFR
jgi:hypothetical protein